MLASAPGLFKEREIILAKLNNLDISYRLAIYKLRSASGATRKVAPSKKIRLALYDSAAIPVILIFS
ncbi:hypothetical protein SAMN04515620_12046 [Collimonas sp. OK607]|nr:hypothetical protein SAMN04515620_12046 [Collimonas sp. OK607]